MSAMAAMIWASIACAALLLCGCEQAPTPPPQEPAEEAPNLMADCYQALTGTWQGHGLDAQYDPASGTAILNYRGNITVVGSVMIRCELPEAAIMGRGYTVEVTLLSPERARFRVPDIGQVVLQRVVSSDR